MLIMLYFFICDVILPEFPGHVQAISRLALVWGWLTFRSIIVILIMILGIAIMLVKDIKKLSEKWGKAGASKLFNVIKSICKGIVKISKWIIFHFLLMIPIIFKWFKRFFDKRGIKGLTGSLMSTFATLLIVIIII